MHPWLSSLLLDFAMDSSAMAADREFQLTTMHDALLEAGPSRKRYQIKEVLEKCAAI